MSLQKLLRAGLKPALIRLQVLPHIFYSGDLRDVPEADGLGRSEEAERRAGAALDALRFTLTRCRNLHSMDGDAVLLVLCVKICLGFGHHGGLTLVMQAESWEAARHYCQTHFVRLATVHTEAQLGPVFEVAKAVGGGVWIGLHRSGPRGWIWVDGQALTYIPWKKQNSWGSCGTIDARLPGDKKLLQRICAEPRPFICQGPVPPDRIEVDAVGTDCVFLEWDRPVAMETVQYSFNVSYAALSGSSVSKRSDSTSTSVCGLRPGSQYVFSVSTVMQTAGPEVQLDSIRPDSVSLSWTPMSSASYLHVSFSSSDGTWSGSARSPANSSRLLVTDLQPQTTYIFQLTVVSLSGPRSIPTTLYIRTCCPPRIAAFSIALWSVKGATPPLAFWLLYRFIKRRSGQKNAAEELDSAENVPASFSERSAV
ncbi:hypothetical protein GN956_G16838 [Arapaima gigas]